MLLPMRSALVFLALTATGASAAQRAAGSPTGSETPAKEPGTHRIIVQFSDPKLGRRELLERKALEFRTKPGVLQAKGLFNVGLLIVVCDSLASTERLMHGLEDDPAVELATPDTYVYADGAPPQDAGGRLLKEVDLPTAGADMRQCSLHAGCAALNLAGDCCPAWDGSLLACCGGSDAEVRYSFLSAHGKYVAAEVWGPLRADRDEVGDWEKFDVIHNDDKTISMKTYFGLFVSAQGDGLVGQNGTVGDAERFTMAFNDDGSVSLRTSLGKYLSAHRDGRVLAISDSILAWERFSVLAFGKLGQRMPNDARFVDLWGMHNDNATDMDCPEAWHTFTGDGSNGIIVGVIDTGIDYTHRDLRANMWVNPGEIPNNGIDDDGNGYVDDIFGADFVNDEGDPMDDQMHGTHCAGTIAAVGNNGIGVAGVAWHGVQLMALKFLSASGSGRTSDAVKAIDYGLAHGAKILSNSWGGGGSNAALTVAIRRAETAGILFTAAAGNSGSDNDAKPHYPSSYTNDNIIAVASTSRTGALSGFSCYGRTTVDVAAPGSQIMSTVPNQGYKFLSGTSMATPAVSGVAALVWMYRPRLQMMQVKDIIMSSVTRTLSLEGKVLTGGRISAAKALAAAAAASETFFPPANAPQAIAFQDTDPAIGIVSGIVTITAALDESDVEYYKVYFLSSAGFPMDAVGNVTATGAKVLEVIWNTPKPMPNFARGLVVVSGNSTGEMSAQIGSASPMVTVEDYGLPETGPQTVSWGGDTDLRKGWVAGRLALKRAPSELSITQYNIYWNLTTGGRGPLVASIPAVGYVEPRCVGATCPLINETRIPGGGYRFNRDSYGNGERAKIQFSGPGQVTVTRFDTEKYYDILTVAKRRISGNPTIPMSLEIPAGPSDIRWYADGSITAAGWTFDLFPENSTVEFQLEASQVVGPGLEVVAAYGSTELPEGIFVDVADYHMDMPPSPAFAPEAIILRGQSTITDTIAGVIEVKPVPNAVSEGGVAYYKLELANVAGEALGDLGRADASGDGAVLFSVPTTSLPSGAVQLLARAGNRFGLGTGKTFLDFAGASSVARSPPKPGQSDRAMGVLGSSSGSRGPTLAVEPWLSSASATEARRAVWPPRPTAELPKDQACPHQGCVLGTVTVPGLDAHDLAAKSPLRKAISVTVADMLPHTTEESVEVVSVFAEVGQTSSKTSSAATVEFLVAPLEGAVANAASRIEARLILLSMGGSGAALFSEGLIKRLAEAGAELPAGTAVRVWEPQQLVPRRPGRSLAAKEPSDASAALQSGGGIAGRRTVSFAGAAAVLGALAALVLALLRSSRAATRGNDKAALECVRMPLGLEA